MVDCSKELKELYTLGQLLMRILPGMTILTTLKIKRNIGILKRMKLTVPRESLVQLYKTLIEPYFRYCNTVWGYRNETLLDKLQVLQNKAARVIKGSKFENTNHPVLLKELRWLNVRQLIFIDTTILMYRVANNLAPETISDMYQVANNVHNYNTRYAIDGNFYLNRANTTIVQRHSSKICMNCALRDKSAKLGTDVEHIITFVLRYGAILKYSPGVYFANQHFQNLQTTRANWFWSLFC